MINIYIICVVSGTRVASCSLEIDVEAPHGLSTLYNVYRHCTYENCVEVSHVMVVGKGGTRVFMFLPLDLERDWIEVHSYTHLLDSIASSGGFASIDIVESNINYIVTQITSSEDIMKSLFYSKPGNAPVSPVHASRVSLSSEPSDAVQGSEPSNTPPVRLELGGFKDSSKDSKATESRMEEESYALQGHPLSVGMSRYSTTDAVEESYSLKPAKGYIYEEEEDDTTESSKTNVKDVPKTAQSLVDDDKFIDEFMKNTSVSGRSISNRLDELVVNLTKALEDNRTYMEERFNELSATLDGLRLDVRMGGNRDTMSIVSAATPSMSTPGKITASTVLTGLQLLIYSYLYDCQVRLHPTDSFMTRYERTQFNGAINMLLRHKGAEITVPDKAYNGSDLVHDFGLATSTASKVHPYKKSIEVCHLVSALVGNWKVCIRNLIMRMKACYRLFPVEVRQAVLYMHPNIVDNDRITYEKEAEKLRINAGVEYVYSSKNADACRAYLDTVLKYS